MRVRCLLVAIALFAALTIAPQHSFAKGNRSTIVSGPGIAHPLAIPYPDDALGDSQVQPWAVAAPRGYLGSPVMVWSEAWLPLIDWPQDQVGVPSGALIGAYYEEQGLLSMVTTSGDTTSGTRWFGLGRQTRRVLDRYIRLARTGAIEERPSQIGAYLAARQLLGEPVPLSVEIGGRQLDDDETSVFWSLLARSPERDLLPSEFQADATHFGPWQHHVWPANTSLDVSVRFCDPAGSCQQWYVLQAKSFLTQTIEGWPSWPGYELTETARQFVQAMAAAAGAPSSGANPVVDPVADAASTADLPASWLPIAAMTVAVLGFLSMRSRRV